MYYYNYYLPLYFLTFGVIHEHLSTKYSECIWLYKKEIVIVIIILIQTKCFGFNQPHREKHILASNSFLSTHCHRAETFSLQSAQSFKEVSNKSMRQGISRYGRLFLRTVKLSFCNSKAFSICVHQPHSFYQS